MTCWYEGPLAAFDTETTGVDVETDRIVSAARRRPGRAGHPAAGEPLAGQPGCAGARRSDGGARADGRTSPAQRPLAGAGDVRDSRGAGRAGRGGPPAGGDERSVRSDAAGPGVAPPPRLVPGPAGWTRAAAACWIRGCWTSIWTATAKAAAPSPTCVRTTAWSWRARMTRRPTRRPRWRSYGRWAAVSPPGWSGCARRAARPAGGVARGPGPGPAGVVRAQRVGGVGGPGLAAASGSAGGGLSRAGMQRRKEPVRLTTDRPFPVGDTGFEPVTSSV